MAYLATKTDKTTITRLSGWTGTASGGSAPGWSRRARPHPARRAGQYRGRRGELAPPPPLSHVGRRPHWQEDRVGCRGQGHCPPWTHSSTSSAPERSAALEAVSMDMGASFNKSVRAEGHARKAVISRRPVPRRQARHRRSGHRAPGDLERAARTARPGRGQEVQRCPLGAAQTTRAPHR